MQVSVLQACGLRPLAPRRLLLSQGLPPTRSSVLTAPGSRTCPALPDPSALLQAGVCLGTALQSWWQQVMEQHSQATMVTGSPWGQALPGAGWGGALRSLADGCSVCHLTQLTGMVIGALLALALVGVTIFFVYRRVNRSREYCFSL